jgi:hypothetical protein
MRKPTSPSDSADPNRQEWEVEGRELRPRDSRFRGSYSSARDETDGGMSGRVARAKTAGARLAPLMD